MTQRKLRGAKSTAQKGFLCLGRADQEWLGFGKFQKLPRKFQKVSTLEPASALDGSENPVVEHKGNV